MTPNKLFFQRLINDWKFQYSVWRLVINWMIALYILLPGFILGVRQYLLWWKVPPTWLSPVPLELFLLIFYIFAWSGSLRIFFEEGDQLFLLAQKKWLKQILKLSLIYSFFLFFVFTLFFLVLLVPFLKYYQVSLTFIIILFFLTFFLKIVVGLAKQLLTIKIYGWKQFILGRLALLLGSIIFLSIIKNLLASIFAIIILFIVSLILTAKRLNLLSNFLSDVEREKNLRFRLASFFLSFSVKDIKKPKNQRLRPWLFPRSNLLFKKRTPQNGLVELGIKAVLRDNQSLKEYFQVLLLCVLIVVTVPVNLKGLVLLALAFIWVNYVGLYWQEITKAPFLQMFAWKREDKALALQKFLFLMSLPGVLLLSLIVGYQTFAWIGTLLVIPISIVLVFYLCKFVTFYLLLKN